MKADIGAVRVKMATGAFRWRFTISGVPGITDGSKSVNTFASKSIAIRAGHLEFRTASNPSNQSSPLTEGIGE